MSVFHNTTLADIHPTVAVRLTTVHPTIICNDKYTKMVLANKKKQPTEN